MPEEQAVQFHHTMVKLLFVSNRAQRDIQTAVVFLTTRVKSPDEDERGELKQIFKYLNGTRNLMLKLLANNLGIIKWFVDASYAIHDDYKEHAGLMMAMGSGAITSFSRKQKINGKSLTDTELIGADDTLPQILWTRYFSEKSRLQN